MSKYNKEYFFIKSSNDIENLPELMTSDQTSTRIKQRLLFKMGKSSNGIKVCHESIKHLFDVPRVQLIPIEDY